MSVEAMTWAFSQQTGSPSAKLVLLVLADYADERGSCWPSQRKIAAKSEQSIDSVQRRLIELQKQDLIECKAQTRPGGRGRTAR